MKLANASCCASVDMQLQYPTVWVASRHSAAKNLKEEPQPASYFSCWGSLSNTFEGALKQDYTGWGSKAFPRRASLSFALGMDANQKELLLGCIPEKEKKQTKKITSGTALKIFPSICVKILSVNWPYHRAGGNTAMSPQCKHHNNTTTVQFLAKSHLACVQMCCKHRPLDKLRLCIMGLTSSHGLFKRILNVFFTMA